MALEIGHCEDRGYKFQLLLNLYQLIDMLQELFLLKILIIVIIICMVIKFVLSFVLQLTTGTSLIIAIWCN